MTTTEARCRLGWFASLGGFFRDDFKPHHKHGCKYHPYAIVRGDLECDLKKKD